MTQLQNRVQLSFKKPVANMIQQAILLHTRATEDMAALAAYDIDIDAAWLTAMQAAIDDLNATPAPVENTGILKDITADVNAKMAEARTTMQDLLFVVKKAFPGQDGKLDSYGKKDFEKARNDQQLMLATMARANRLMAADSAALIAKGWLQSKIDAFGALYTALLELDQDQEKQKGDKSDDTSVFYEKANIVWDNYVMRIHEAGTIAFRDDQEKLKQYMLYPENDTTPLEFTVDVAPGAIVYHRILTALQPAQPIIIKMLLGEGVAHVCFSMNGDAGGFCQNPALTLPNLAEMTWTYQEFGAVGQYMRFTHGTGSAPMKIRVTLPGL